MKKFGKLLIAISGITLLCACGTNKDALRFKEEYESLNGHETSVEGRNYRTITIDEKNPFVYTTLDDVNKKIENKETFIVYFGANWCPWCRSVLPIFIEEAKEAKVDKVYYIDVRPDNDIEKDIRDVYSLGEDNKPYISHEGTEAYHKFLEYADSILSFYSSHGVTLTDGTKRVGAPNFIYVIDGVPTKKVTGVSDKETDAYMELTDEIKEDTKNIFKDFFETK